MGDTLDLDHELIALVRSGSIGAFGLLYRRHQPAVRRVLRRSEANPADLDDLVQEVFLRGLSQLDSLSDPLRFRYWLYAIARHVGTDHVRRQARRPELRAEVPEQCDVDDSTAAMEARELASLIRDACAVLTPRDAWIIYLTSCLGFTPTEVASAIGLSPQASKVAAHRARRRLHDVLAVETSVAKNGVGCSTLREHAAQGRYVEAAKLLKTCPQCDHAAFVMLMTTSPASPRAESRPRCAAPAPG